VIGYGNGLEVFGAVVCLASVDVMDAVPGRNRADLAFVNEELLFDIAMTGSRVLRCKDHPIAVNAQVATAFPSAVGAALECCMPLSIETRPTAIPVVNSRGSGCRGSGQAAAAVTDARHLRSQFRRRLHDRVLGRSPTVNAGLRTKARAAALPLCGRIVGLATELASVHATSIPPLSRRNK
jgi:hypothetical protein